MKQKWAFIIVLILMGCNLNKLTAQVLKEINDVDFIKIEANGALSYYEQKKDECRKIIVDEEMPTRGTITTELENQWIKTSSLSNSVDQLIQVKDIRTYTSKELLNYLEKFQFRTKRIDDTDTIYTHLQMFNPYLMLVTNEELWNSSAETKTDYEYTFSSYCIIKLRANKHIVLMHPSTNRGYIIPIKNKDKIYVDNQNFHELTVEKNKIKKDWQLDERMKYIFSRLSRSGDYYYMDFTDDEKMILVGNYEARLLPEQYDKIEMGGYFIAAKKGIYTQIFNLFLKPIAKNVIAYNFDMQNGRVMHILIDNKVVTIDYNGKINPRKQYMNDDFYHQPQHASRHRVSENFYVRAINKEYYVFKEFKDDDNRTYNHKAKFKIELPETISFENVYMASKIEDQQFFFIKKDGYTGYFSIDFSNIKVNMEMVKETNIKKTYGDTIFTGTPIIPTELIPISMDSIVPVNYFVPKQLFIFKNGLKGVYPFHKTPKYQTLTNKPVGDFLRFEMIGERGGWLDLRTGKEYLD